MRSLSFRHRFALAASLAVLTVSAAPRHSWADGPQGHLRLIRQTTDHAQLLFSATGLSGGAKIDPGSVAAAVNGVPASASASEPAGTTKHAVQRVMLVFDTSGSMAGAGLAGARAAASTFLGRVPGGVQVGLVAFADRPRLVVVPSTSRHDVRVALDGLKAGGETSLYDGIDLAIHALGHPDASAIVVLSDGADTRSVHSLAGVATELRASGIRMDAVALHTGDATLRTLRRLATDTGGLVLAADNGSELAAAFSSAADALADQVLVDVTMPAKERGRDVTVTVTASSKDAAMTASVTFHVAGEPAPARSPAHVGATAHPKRPADTPAIPLLVLFAGLLLLSYGAVSAVHRRRSPVARSSRLLERFSLMVEAPSTTHDEKGAGSVLLRHALVVAKRFTAKAERHERLSGLLVRADVHLEPHEWLVVRCGVALGGLVLGLFAFHVLFPALLAGLVGYIAAGQWLARKARRRSRAFEEHLPGALQLVASSVRSGFSLVQALDAVVREGMEPIAGEVNRALAEARLGIPIEDALDNLARRVDSEDFRWVAMAIRIQREVGGNLAEVLLNTGMMMRERARLRREVRTLSAEGRLSAYVLLALPVFMSLFFFTFRRAYIRPLYTQPMGIGMLVVALVLLMAGSAWMRKTVNVKV